MKSFYKGLMRLALVVSLGVGFFSASSMSGMAESNRERCKALSRAQCDAASKCIWLKSYKTKAGTRIRAHCLAKNQSKSSVMNKLFNGNGSSATRTRILSKKRINIMRNPKPTEKLK